ncbi:hypothetical protein LOZ86_20140 [Pectobacterium parvum]|uniref:FAD-binding FR-type domain-containing protein n=1 Tax=Pectobacterium parvum TaxID=2778550 RepID=A0AAP9IFK2_9GAMM|nr:MULTISPECIES: hypothetical protein [Pectobacterium]GKW40563.1 hypothetical protein PEC301879_04220 [Pectobacterium carotovorum subsp. carotovorum]KFX18158.1 hypothetical protein KP17_04985 [Pectobacterium parvum]KHS98053.1 hypothetical protein RC88_04625 [Pectobacterium parvum]QHQ23554.1 hypothetical protein GMX10_05295 [Pectobacterium parvum]UFK39152.1 hypothetical protein LOZ86_20140 [Pectobacterium parvum]
MSFLSQQIIIKPCQIEVKDLNEKTYLVKIRIASYHYLPGQYVKLSCGSELERCFSISSWHKSKDKDDEISIELIIGFNELLSVSHRIILEIQSGNSIAISLPLGKAHWRQSDYGNVLIACDTGYSYVRGIIQYLAKHYSEQPTSLIYINDKGANYFTGKDIHELFDSNENFHFRTMYSSYAGRDISFVKKTVETISQSHFSLSNFYIGSGKDFFKLIKNELHTLGVNEGRIISDNC